MGRGTARAAPRSSDRAPTYWRKVLRHPRRVDLAGVRFEAGQELGVDLVLHGPPVEIQSTRRLLIAAGLGVDQGAVAPQKLVGIQRSGQHLLSDSLPSRDTGLVRRLILATDHHVAHALLQLADVARPAIAVAELRVDPALGLLRQWLGLGLARHAPGEEAHQSPALARRGAQLLLERGRDDDVRAKPIVEILAEAAGRHLGRQVAVGGRDDLAVEATVARVAEPLERARLQHAQQLDLERRLELADLVEEDGSQRPADLEPPRPILHGAGEGAAAM